MRKLLLAVLMLSGQAAAEWVFVADGEKFSTWIDPATIRRSGDTAMAWVVFDFGSSQPDEGKAALSMKTRQQFDCGGKRDRSVSHSVYSGQMATGALLREERTVGQWLPIAPDSIGESLYDFVCGSQ